MYDFFAWVLVGGAIGWVASLIGGSSTQSGRMLDVLVGVAGAFFAGLILSPVFGISAVSQSGFSFPALGVALVGAIILLGVTNLFRPSTVV